NAGTMFCALKPFEERAGHADLSAAAVTGKLMGQYRQLDEGFALVFPPPPVRGIGSAGGFRIQIEDRSGQATPQELEAVVGQVIVEASKNGQLAQLFSGF